MSDFSPDNQNQSKMIKPKRFKRFIKLPNNTLKTVNRFLILPIDECNIVEGDISQSDSDMIKFKNVRKGQDEHKSTKLPIKKEAEKGWKMFETINRFEALVDNTEEDVIEIIKRNIILNTPKHCLKKCNRCKFKKRTCTLDSSTCQAIQRCCVRCGKNGHYPQSFYCKSKKNLIKNSKSRSKTCGNISRSSMLSKDVLLVLNKRINQIEMSANIE